MSLIETFLSAVERRREAPAIIEGSGRVTSYADLARASSGRARAYAQAGIGVGDRVLVARGVDRDFYACLLALFRLGAVAVFPEPGAGLAGLRCAIEAARPKAVCLNARTAWLRLISSDLATLPVLRARAISGACPPASAPREAPALITFTSGSAGKPKGIVRSGADLDIQHTLLERIRQTSADDIDLISLPIFVLSNLAVGATSVLPDGDMRAPAAMSPDRLGAQIQRHRINRIIAPPALCARLAERDQSALEAIFTGGGPVFPDLWRALERAAPAANIVAVYGSTEAEPIASIAGCEISARDWRSMETGAGLLAGQPIAETRIALIDDEIQVSGAHVNRGYLNPEQNIDTKVERGGQLWHRTGDCARFDAEGRLWLLGRKTAAREGVFPFAIETAARGWPGITGAALAWHENEPCLAIAGAQANAAEARRRAADLGVARVVKLNSIPTDARHNSKIDYARLARLISASMPERNVA